MAIQVEPPAETGGVPNPILGGRFLRQREAAAFLGRTPRTLAKWQELGIGPPLVRLGGKTPLYPIEGIQQWLMERVEQRPRRRGRPRAGR